MSIRVCVKACCICIYRHVGVRESVSLCWCIGSIYVCMWIKRSVSRSKKLIIKKYFLIGIKGSFFMSVAKDIF